MVILDSQVLLALASAILFFTLHAAVGRGRLVQTVCWTWLSLAGRASLRAGFWTGGLRSRQFSTCRRLFLGTQSGR